MTDGEREATIVRLYPVVRTIARTVASRIGRVDLDDLVGDGSLGLIRAVDSYDPARGGASLERYARACILGAMLNGLRRMDRLTEFTRRILRAAERDRYAIALMSGRMPSMLEMERRHPKLRFARIAAHELLYVSLDDAIPVDALVTPNWEADPARVYCEYESRALLQDAIEKLPLRHRLVVNLYFFSGYRLKTVAQKLSVSKQRVAQLRDDALEIVRDEVRSA
jgi:RNA polymerase sigma factor for flagellar operon FliA